MSKVFSLLVLPGDGVGTEVVDAGLKVMEVVCSLHDIHIELCHDQIGGSAYDQYGTFCRDETVSLAKQSDAVLVGAVGGPKWDGLDIHGSAADKDGLMRLRQELDTYAGLRPAKSYPSLLERTPFKTAIVQNSDILVLREMCGGCFFREPRGIKKSHTGVRSGFDNYLYESDEIERIAVAGFQLARKRKGHLASLDKSNVLESGALWRQCVDEVGKQAFPDVTLEHYYADNGFYQMMSRPNTFDVVLADNLFGDLGSDLAACVSGSLGMLPSACVPGFDENGISIGPGIYEPVHGSAPDIAGQNRANPMGTILSVAMIFEYAMGRKDLSDDIEQAVQSCLNEGVLTSDIGGSHSTDQVRDAVINGLMQNY